MPYPTIIRIPPTIPNTFYNISDTFSNINTDIKTIDDHYKPIPRPKFSHKYEIGVVIINPGDNTWDFIQDGADDEYYYSKEIRKIFTNSTYPNSIADVQAISQLMGAPNNGYLYNASDDLKMLYVKSPTLKQDVDIKKCITNPVKYEFIKTGIIIALLIAKYNSVSQVNKIKNIRLPGISTIFKIIGMKRYYLNYMRDLVLHSMTATLFKVGELSNIDSIQLYNQESNQYDIYGSFFHTYTREIDEDTNVVNETVKHLNMFDYYLINGDKYISNFQIAANLNLADFKIAHNHIIYIDNLHLLADEKSIDNALINVIDNTSKLSNIQTTPQVNDIMTQYDNTHVVKNADSTEITTRNGVNSISGPQQSTNNLCWFHTSNQFLLSIPEIGNYLLKNTRTEPFFIAMRKILKYYDETNVEADTKKSNELIEGLILFINTTKITNLPPNPKKTPIGWNYFETGEAQGYLDEILGLTTYNGVLEYIELLCHFCGFVEVNLKSMYYPELHPYQSISYCGYKLTPSNHLQYSSNTSLNNYLSIRNGSLTLFFNMKKDHSFDIASINNDLEDKVINYEAKKVSVGNALKDVYYNTDYKYIITSKYLIVNNVWYSDSIPSNFINTVFFDIELKNGYQYTLKSIIINIGGGKGHYNCLKRVKDNVANTDLLYTYDDITNSGAKHKQLQKEDIKGVKSKNFYNFIEYLLYERVVSNSAILTPIAKSTYDSIKLGHSDIKTSLVDQEKNSSPYIPPNLKTHITKYATDEAKEKKDAADKLAKKAADDKDKQDKADAASKLAQQKQQEFVAKQIELQKIQNELKQKIQSGDAGEINKLQNEKKIIVAEQEKIKTDEIIAKKEAEQLQIIIEKQKEDEKQEQDENAMIESLKSLSEFEKNKKLIQIKSKKEIIKKNKQAQEDVKQDLLKTQQQLDQILLTLKPNGASLNPSIQLLGVVSQQQSAPTILKTNPVSQSYLQSTGVSLVPNIIGVFEQGYQQNSTNNARIILNDISDEKIDGIIVKNTFLNTKEEPTLEELKRQYPVINIQSKAKKYKLLRF